MSRALRVLIIEDSEDDTLLLVREVKRGGYEVVYERVDTPLAMETALKQKTWDIVISDYSMPKFSAPGALALLGEQRLDLPFIIVSGKIGEDTAVAAMKDGANDYIMKDNLVRLIPVIKRELHDAEARREHRRAKEIITEQSEIMELFFKHTLDCVVLLDRNFNFIRVNEAYARVCQRDVSEFPGRNHFELYPSDTINIFKEVVRTKKSFQTEARPFVFPDHPEWGVTYWDWTLVPVLDQGGEVKLLVFTLKDVTEHKLAEKEREHLNKKLAQKNKELGQIIYVSSHDLRTPLVNVNGYSKEFAISLKEITSILDKEGVSPEIKEKLAPFIEDSRESLEYVNEGISRMDKLLNGLLQFSRSGRADIKREKLDMNGLMSSVFNTFEYKVNETRVKFETSELPPCVGDEIQINQVFSNLIGNALKYLDPCQPGVIKVSGNNENRQSVYCVEDNGIGIASDYQEKIFDIFHQLEPARGGEGLGLSIVQSIVEKHNGKIWVESEPGKGSKFFVSLPV